jgi:uncharacterized protein (DUF885 family)
MNGLPNRTATLVLMVATLAATGLAIGPTGPSAHAELDTLARQAYRTLWDFHPVDATRSGFHEFDGRLGNYTPVRVAALKLRLKDYLQQLNRLDTLRLSLDDRIDRALLVSNLRMELFWLERFRLLERDPHFYSDECVGGVYYVLLREFAPLPVRALRAAERLADVRPVGGTDAGPGHQLPQPGPHGVHRPVSARPAALDAQDHGQSRRGGG